MSSGMYILEVQQFCAENLFIEGMITDQPVGFLHVGYMKALFNTKKQAAEYYKKYNAHMRDMNYKFVSDLDPVNNLRYIVRPENGENLSIEPFHSQCKSEIKMYRYQNGYSIIYSLSQK